MPAIRKNAVFIDGELENHRANNHEKQQTELTSSEVVGSLCCRVADAAGDMAASLLRRVTMFIHGEAVLVHFDG